MRTGINCVAVGFIEHLDSGYNIKRFYVFSNQCRQLHFITSAFCLLPRAQADPAVSPSLSVITNPFGFKSLSHIELKALKGPSSCPAQPSF